MSFQYLNQTTPQYNKNGRLNDLIVDNNITTNDLQINRYTFNKVLLINQLTSSTTSVDANYKCFIAYNNISNIWDVFRRRQLINW